MALKIGICGTGAFADCFISLFNAHPLVDRVVLADLDAEKLKAECCPKCKARSIQVLLVACFVELVTYLKCEPCKHRWNEGKIEETV